ncbi:SpvB/TcaC N-terminal domain-containing protein, partial [Glycomyces albidus]|uniref:SpvB/TcaC N-terminal domain-containing protein n=1 Tax=Glycomyces albidus TaxID=2656774 RepID=UPI001884016E
MDAHWGGAAGPERAGRAPVPAPGAAAAPSLPAIGSPPARLGETFQTSPVTGSASLSIPLPFSAGRGAPSMAVGYDSSRRAGLFGYGWDLPVPQISRRTDRGVPRYRDGEASDVFLADGGEDLVPVDESPAVRTVAGTAYRIDRYRPRIDSGLTRIERWTSLADRADCKWRTLSGDNHTAWFGEDPGSRIADPEDPARIFAWLISFSHDDKGGAVAYEYAAEDAAGIDPGAASEAHRTDLSRSAARHLKRIRYGNASPHHPVLDPVGPPVPRPASWLFTLVLDYGDHDPDAPAIEPDLPWPARPDPYSDCRPGFEVRTYRRCARALMFHDIPELGPEPTLVRSVDFSYAADEHSGDSHLTAAASAGYERDGDGYLRAPSPPLTFHYQPSTIDPTVRDVDAERLPAGLDLADHTWVDLDGDGVAGVLAARRGAWYYLRNTSPLREPGEVGFAAAAPVAAHPETGLPGLGADLLLDLDGGGTPDLVRFAPGNAAYAGRDDDGGWKPFAPFDGLPEIDLAAGDLHLADLTGDGLPDLVLDDPAGVRWCPNRGGAFAAPRPLDLPDDRPPSLGEHAAAVAVRLADLTGDGLPDLVRLANGAVTYRPNLGHGRFGPAVAMDDAPWFDHPDRFDPRRAILTDIDGNGRSDLVYLAADGVRLYANRAGAAWSPPRTLPGLPAADNRRVVSAVDLRGNGTACLVWSTGLPSGAAPLRYIDLHSAGVPHLLSRYENGGGGEVRIEYRSSTSFAQADERDGRPWPGKLPFPVACAHKVTRVDHVRETVFTSTTSYHDGHFDPVEREFRGFGLVESIDSEAYEVPPAGIDPDPDLRQPPVRTRTWFHTGAAAGAGERMLHTRRGQYWQNPVLPEPPLPEPDLPPGLTDDEYRQACRALKGVTLRTETYGLDAAPESAVPYAVTEAAYAVALRQSQGGRRHAVFQVLPTEAVSYGYDRVPADPRVSHSFVLEADDLGQPVRTATVAYPRAEPDPALPQAVRDAQARLRAGYEEVDQTADIDAPDTRSLRQVWETRSFELAGLPAGRLTTAEVDAAVAAAERVPYEHVDDDGTVPAPDGPVLRLTARSQMFFRSDDLAGPLPLGVHGALGLAHHSRSLAFTDGLVAAHYDGTVTAADLTAAGYAHFDGGWWAPSGTDLYAPDAAQHFHLPAGGADPFGVASTIERDDYDLAVVTVTDPLGFQTHFEHDYRVLAARAVTDAAGNRAEVAFDARGAIVAAALLGRPGEPGMDSLADPTATMEYDPFAWVNERRPAWTRTRRRERHGAADTAWQESYAYFDGSGAAVMVKGRVAPGPALAWDPDTETATEVDADPRWVGNGRTIVNNKGLPVKQYEPYFSTTSGYESEAALVELGVTAVPSYDPLGRVFRTDYPDGTHARTEIGPWRSASYDAGDTVLDSAWYAERGSPDPLGPEPADAEQRAAWLAARHADTPAVAYLDVLGRTVMTVADNGGGDLRTGRSEADVTGGFAREFDTRDRLVSASVRNLAGVPMRADAAERGVRWSFSDVVGRLVRSWDEHGRTHRIAYDAVHRPVAAFAADADEPETMTTRIVYGETHPEAAERNLIGQAHLMFDGSGVAVFDRLDHRGRPVRTLRRFTADPETEPDWSVLDGVDDPALALATAGPLLEPVSEQTESTAAFDALGRMTAAVLPDGTVMDPAYDEGNQLASLRARIGGAGPFRQFLLGQEYDAMGRRSIARHGNGLATRYDYDPLSRRVAGVRTAAEGAADAVQDLHYVYDAAGRLVETDDTAQQSHFFAGAFVPARMRFRHDAIGQLVQASGREHAGIAPDQQTGSGDLVGAPLPHPNDSAAVRLYTEQYEYDDLGNLTLMRHMANGGGWTRRYRYAHEADPADRRNRLAATSVPSDDPDGPYSHQYTYDAYGNLTSAPHLAAVSWNRSEQLRSADLGGGGTAWFCYTGDGARARKVVQRQGGLRTERRYLGAVEVYREWMNGVLRLERRTVHIGDGAGRFAQADTLTADPGGIDGAPLGVPVIRYQYGDHLGSAALETDEDGAVITYEEYHPYGSSAYRSSRPGTDLSLKRFRFHGKERDEETGLYHYGARSYASWLGRWISADPIGTAAGPNQYAYCANDPVGKVDPNGTQERVTTRTVRGPTPAEVRRYGDIAHPTPAQQVDPAFRARVRDFFNSRGMGLTTLPQWVDGRWFFNEHAPAEAEGEGEGSGGAGGDAGGGTGTGAGTGPGAGSGSGADAGGGT